MGLPHTTLCEEFPESLEVSSRQFIRPLPAKERLKTWWFDRVIAWGWAGAALLTLALGFWLSRIAKQITDTSAIDHAMMAATGLIGVCGWALFRQAWIRHPYYKKRITAREESLIREYDETLLAELEAIHHDDDLDYYTTSWVDTALVCIKDDCLLIETLTHRICIPTDSVSFDIVAERDTRSPVYLIASAKFGNQKWATWINGSPPETPLPIHVFSILRTAGRNYRWLAKRIGTQPICRIRYHQSAARHHAKRHKIPFELVDTHDQLHHA